MTTTAPHTRVIPSLEARELKRANRAGEWAAIVPGFGAGVWPEVHPSFRLRSSDVIFTIGSCFARNVEDHLARLGCIIPMLDFRLPPEEWHGPANGALNKFSPPVFRQSLEWTAAIHDRDGKVTWDDCARLAWDCGGDRWADMELLARAPVPRERFVERRQHVFDIVRTAFTADCVMMTPGLVEAWRHTSSGFYVHGFKGRYMIDAFDQFQFEVLGYPQCVADLLAAIDIIRARNPRVKVLVTTSPVPLAGTFTDQDIRVANTYSKSVLRAACGALTLERPVVDYFPSFESAVLSDPGEVWAEDRVHVQPGFVGRIVSHLLDSYFDDVDKASRLHQLASTELADQQSAKAAEHAAAALALKPDDDAVRYLLVDALFAERRADEARAAIAPLLAATPPLAATQGRLARILHSQGEVDLAIETVLQACTLPDATIGNFSWAIKRLVALGRDGEAEQLSRDLIARWPLHAAAYQPLIDLLDRLGRSDDLVIVLRHAVELPLPRPAHIALLEARSPSTPAQ